MKNEKGFTLVELMIVVAFILILATVDIPHIHHQMVLSYKHDHGHWPIDWNDAKEYAFNNGTVCDPSNNTTASSVPSPSEEIQYFKDSKNGLCFARIGNALTQIDCAKVSLYSNTH